MASASSSSARNLFSDSKRRLADRVTVNVHNAASVARQIVRGSKSNEILMQSAKSFAQQESAMENSLQKLKKIDLIAKNQNIDGMIQGAEKLEYIREQVNAMER